MIIFGYPGTGKTFLTKQIKEQKTQNAIESDEYLKSLWPEYYNKKLYENKSERDKAHKIIGDYVKNNYHRFKSSPNHHFITNIHPSLTHSEIKSDYAFYHSNFDPTEEEQKEKRWTKEFVQQLKEWNDNDSSLHSNKRQYVDNFIVMPNDKHISDYFKFELHNLVPK